MRVLCLYPIPYSLQSLKSRSCHLFTVSHSCVPTWRYEQQSHAHKSQSPNETKSYILVPGLCKWVTSSIPLPLRLAEETRSSSPRWRNVISGSRSCRAYIGPGSLWTTVDWATTRGHQWAVTLSLFVRLLWRQVPVHPEVLENTLI